METKHFIDTSVVRPLIASSAASKKYYYNNLGPSRYITDYVKMEYIRGFIMPLMQFYGFVTMPGSNGFVDAIFKWNQKYSARELKAVSALAASILENLTGNRADLIRFTEDREFQKRHLADYITRLLLKIDTKFTNTGADRDMCSKCRHIFTLDLTDLENSFVVYYQKFMDRKNADSCKINSFLKRHSKESDKVVTVSVTAGEAVKKIGEALKKYSSGDKVTCYGCKDIGDFVITVQAPDTFRIEHTDSSFDTLAPTLGKRNYKHPSEASLK